MVAVIRQRLVPLFEVNICLDLCQYFASLVSKRTIHTTCSLRNWRFVNSCSVSEITKEENIKAFIERLQKITVPVVFNHKTEAAVFVPLCVDNGEVCLLYTIRKSNLRSHGRQTSFPGGKREGIESLIETAVRETQEELGIGREVMKIWGHGRPIHSSEYIVLPVIGFIGDVSELYMKPNPDEVESVFTVPLSHFCDTKNCKVTRFRRDGRLVVLPVFINTKQRIWGLTGIITHVILLGLLPNDYNVTYTCSL